MVMERNTPTFRRCPRLVAWRRRRNERGAAIFVVISVVTVLTAVGMFAAHTAGLNQRMSGFARQASQSEYVADYGTMAAVNEMSSGAAPAYMQLVVSGSENCRANQYVEGGGAGMPCYRLTKRDIEKRMETESGATSLFAATGLSSTGSELLADFVVEMTDPGPAGRPVAGMDQSGVGPRFRYMQLTFSGTGQVRPKPASAAENDSVAKMSAVRANRAVVQVGPLPH